MDIESLKQQVANEIDANKEELINIAKLIHENPEIGNQEFKAMEWLTEPLKEAGYTVEKGVAGLETGFRGTWEIAPDGPTIALLCEYDALRGLGHGCGHNLIGTASVGAGLALKKVLGKNPLPGRIQVIGTPSEEIDGGKVIMVEKGVFDNVDAAMMFHPKDKTMVVCGALACFGLNMTFHGKAAHAAAAPHEGINALDACIQTFNAINALRQHFKDGIRIHGIITHGGDAPNIVPDLVKAEFILRATTLDYLSVIEEKVITAAKCSAASMGATVEFEKGLVFAERKNNQVMADLFAKNLNELGIEVSEPPKVGQIGSSDIGNVSLVTPTIHPYVSIAPEGTPGHTIEFREYAGSDSGMQGMLSAAKALAMTAIDLLADKEILAAVKEEFDRNENDK